MVKSPFTHKEVAVKSRCSCRSSFFLPFELAQSEEKWYCVFFFLILNATSNNRAMRCKEGRGKQ